MMRMAKKRIFSILMGAIVTFAFAVPALADDTGIDVAEKGSITVDIKAYATDQAVVGGSLNLYYIAGVASSNGETVYQYQSAFSECDDALLDANRLTQAETAECFADFVKECSVAAIDTREVSSSGEAVFTDLSVGLYLITQNRTADGYDAVKAFLVTLPFQEDGNTWTYDVNASPKTSPVKRLCTLTVNLQDYADGTALSGAQFSLQNNEGAYAMAAETGNAALYASLSPVALTAADSNVWSSSQVTFTVPETGFTFYDLEEGDYVLIQVTANDGYLLPDDSICFTLESDATAVIASAPTYHDDTLAVVSGTAGNQTITVKNVRQLSAASGGNGGDSARSPSSRVKTGDYNLYLYGVMIAGAAFAIVLALALRKRAKKAAK